MGVGAGFESTSRWAHETGLGERMRAEGERCDTRRDTPCAHLYPEPAQQSARDTLNTHASGGRRPLWLASHSEGQLEAIQAIFATSVHPGS
jgi:hypothetical protein